MTDITWTFKTINLESLFSSEHEINRIKKICKLWKSEIHMTNSRDLFKKFFHQQQNVKQMKRLINSLKMFCSQSQLKYFPSNCLIYLRPWHGVRRLTEEKKRSRGSLRNFRSRCRSQESEKAHPRSTRKNPSYPVSLCSFSYFMH